MKNEDGALLELKDMDNSDMQDLFVEVAKFVEFYSLAAQDPHNEDAIGVAEDMDNSNREGILLRCLSIPSYDVRLAVTTCLTHVGCDQLQIEEINTLLMHVRNTENISAGETEIVLGKIFNIFSKLVRYYISVTRTPTPTPTPTPTGTLRGRSRQSCSSESYGNDELRVGFSEQKHETRGESRRSYGDFRSLRAE